MKLDWDTIFRDAHICSWPTASLSVQNAKPPHETARNIFKDDEREIMAAARRYNYVIVSPPKAKVVSFVRRADVTQNERNERNDA